MSAKVDFYKSPVMRFFEMSNELGLPNRRSREKEDLLDGF
jgi:hypothetical protein